MSELTTEPTPEPQPTARHSKNGRAPEPKSKPQPKPRVKALASQPRGLEHVPIAPQPITDTQFGRLGAHEAADLARCRALEGDTRSVDLARAEELASEAQRVVREVLSRTQNIVIGDNVAGRARATLAGLLFGKNVFLIGTSGVAKTLLVKVLRETLNLPWWRQDCHNQLTPSDLLGGEFLVPDRGWHRVLGALTAPNLVVLLDEANRLATNTQSALLQALEERVVNVIDYDSGAGYRVQRLFRGTSFILTGNLGSYGGVAQPNEALLDRIEIGIDMPHPRSVERVRMLGSELSDHRAVIEPIALPMGFSLSALRAAVPMVSVSEDQRRLIVQLSRLVSPTEFTEFVQWHDDLDVAGSFVKTAKKKHYDLLRGRVDEAFLEGGNPRGERIALMNARAFALMDGQLTVTNQHVVDGFFTAFRMRMKAFPGFDAKVPDLLRTAIRLMGYEASL